jgi:hypothetical protein
LPTKQRKLFSKSGKPLSPFFMFISDRRAAIKRRNPGISKFDVAKRAGELWSQLSEHEKQRYSDQFEQAKIMTQNGLLNNGSEKRRRKSEDKESKTKKRKVVNRSVDEESQEAAYKLSNSFSSYSAAPRGARAILPYSPAFSVSSIVNPQELKEAEEFARLLTAPKTSGLTPIGILMREEKERKEQTNLTNNSLSIVKDESKVSMRRNVLSSNPSFSDFSSLLQSIGIPELYSLFTSEDLTPDVLHLLEPNEVEQLCKTIGQRKKLGLYIKTKRNQLKIPFGLWEQPEINQKIINKADTQASSGLKEEKLPSSSSSSAPLKPPAIKEEMPSLEPDPSTFIALATENSQKSIKSEPKMRQPHVVNKPQTDCNIAAKSTVDKENFRSTNIKSEFNSVKLEKNHKRENESHSLSSASHVDPVKLISQSRLTSFMAKSESATAAVPKLGPVQSKLSFSSRLSHRNTKEISLISDSEEEF